MGWPLAYVLIGLAGMSQADTVVKGSILPLRERECATSIRTIDLASLSALYLCGRRICFAHLEP